MRKNGKKYGSDFTRVDAHITQPHEYDELPELTDEMLERAVVRRAGKMVGRPPKANRKISVTLRLDPAVVAAFKAGGDGWQTRMNDVLRKAAGLERNQA